MKKEYLVPAMEQNVLEPQGNLLGLSTFNPFPDVPTPSDEL